MCNLVFDFPMNKQRSLPVPRLYYNQLLPLNQHSILIGYFCVGVKGGASKFCSSFARFFGFFASIFSSIFSFLLSVATPASGGVTPPISCERL
mmetsp:Transcript_3183/g.5791  ORF Transcript_3183/g.5791 Transcript_3183/m.5791 type:complete len:93 (+) Transcript_3183:140-418(+)